ncbi:MAG: MFS transporter [Pseudomonadota bacterium]
MNQKIYITLFLTIMSTAMGASIVLPLLPVYAVQMGATGFELGLIFSGFALARSIFLPLVGQWADQYGRRVFLLTGLTIYTGIALAFSLAETVYQLVLCRFVQGAGAAMVIPIARAYVGDLTPPGQEGRLMGHFNIAFFGGLACGPWLGGFIKDYVGLGFAFYSMAALSLAGLALAFVNLPRQGKKRFDLEKKSGGSYLGLLGFPGVLPIFLFRFGTIIGLGVNWTFLPILGYEQLRLSSTRIGILVSLTVVMTTLMQPFFGRLADKVDRSRMAMVGGVLASLCLLAAPFTISFYQLFVVNLVMGAAIGVYMPPLMAIAVDAGRASGFMNKVMSLLEMAFSFGMVIGPLLAGLIKETLGLRAIFWFGGGVGLLSCLTLLLPSPGRATAARSG